MAVMSGLYGADDHCSVVTGNGNFSLSLAIGYNADITWLEKRSIIRAIAPVFLTRASLQIVCGAWRLGGRLRFYLEVIYLSFLTLKLST